MKTVIRALLLAASIVIALIGGFVLQRSGTEPFNRWANQIERKLGKMAGKPSETQQLVDLVETTFLRLRGTAYEIPDNHYVRGGALTVWGEDLVVLDRLGRLYILDERSGLTRLQGLAVPDNGLSAYEAEIAAGVWEGYTNKPETIRYNDIEYIDAAPVHGLALSYTFYDPQRRCYGNRVAWLPIAPAAAQAATFTAAASDWRVIYESTPCLDPNPTWTAIDGMMAGGRMAFQAPSTLYLGNGDFHLDGIHTYDVGVQDDATDYGKILAIDVRTGAARHVSKGHRNLQGLAIDSQGRLWSAEHGVRGGDELNLVREGAAYGWPEVSLGTLYSGQPIPVRGVQGQHDFQVKPVFAWLPSAAVSALAAIEGFDPAWNGNLLAGSLSSAEFGQSLFNIKIVGERVMYVERIRIGRRIRDVRQWGPDRIAVWLDTNEVVIFRSEPRVDPLGEALAQLSAGWSPDLRSQVRSTMAKCAECHSFEPNLNTAAPSLNGVWGRDIASTAFAGYSDALADVDGRWSAETLGAFLSDPAAFAPGTSMPAPNLAPGPLMDAVIETLKAIDTADKPDLRYN